MHLLTCFPGWTWEYIDREMTIPRWRAIQAYQKKHPALHLIMASYTGVNKAIAEADADAAPAEESLLDLMPQGPKFKPG